MVLKKLLFLAFINSGYREFEDLMLLYRNNFADTIGTDLFKSENDDTTLKYLFLRLIIICTFIYCKPFIICRIIFC